MTVRVVGVPSTAAAAVWPHVEGWVEKALEHEPGYYEAGDILAKVEARDMQLWAIADESRLIGCAVTEFLVYPRRRAARLLIVGGAGMHRWIGALDVTLTAWGRSMGCDRLETGGRRGWSRMARALGWTAPVHPSFRKEI